MKRLIVGGAHQGKRAYAEAAWGLTEMDFASGGRAVDSLHLRVRRWLEVGREPKDELAGLLADRGDWVILCDEIGSGVVPVDAFDRRWREETGRLCCALAQEADVVERVTCGIPLRLKSMEDEVPR